MYCLFRWSPVCLVLVSLGLITPNAKAQQSGFDEAFALAEDRTVPLGQLIPGTQTYYYYHCLHFQNTQQFNKVDETLRAWRKRHPASDQYREIQYRQAILTYERNPEQSLTFIRNELGLTFHHKRDRIDKTPTVPSILDPKLLDVERLKGLAFKQYSGLDGFENSALHWLLSEEIDADRRRILLNRLTRPDYDILPRLIVADLEHKNSSGFGSLTIHSRLLKTQLDELLKLRPQLRNNTRFIEIYLSRLAPGEDIDPEQDIDEHQAWLQRLEIFTDTLNDSHNSLKAHVLYHRLVLDQQTGQRNRQRFLKYVQLPRNAPYANPEWLRMPGVSRQLCDLSLSFSKVTQMRPVGNDEPVLRDYLLEFFRKDSSYRGFEPFLKDTYLQHLFAEAKIVNGLGDAEQWYSLLPADAYQRLKERVDIDFLPNSRRFYTPDEPVSLDVNIKNVPTLIVKVFEINTLNYHTTHLDDVNTDINLDGLIANDEQTYDYSEPALRRVTRKFHFPRLNRRGTYVIDFIGNGQSSRALIRKGRLRYVMRSDAAGQAFTVLDENNEVVKDARIFLGARQYDARDGIVRLPFSAKPESKSFVIASSDDFSTVARFESLSETYKLAAGMHVDRESLLRQRMARLLVRPLLTLNGTPVSVSQLEDVKLVVTSRDHDKVETRQEINGFELFENKESVHEFSVPRRLSSLNFVLTAKIHSMSLGKDVVLAANHSLQLNQIDKTEKISDLHLLKSDLGYVLEMRGRTGEVRSDRTVEVFVKHRDFKRPIQQSLATDESGQIVLGPLTNVDHIRVAGSGLQNRRWSILDDRHSYYSVVHAIAGESVRIPWMETGHLDRSLLSLVEMRNSQPVADYYSLAKLESGFLVIDGLPAGDFHLNLYPGPREILVRVTKGRQEGDFLIGRNRQLEQRGMNPLQIESLESDAENVTLRLGNSTSFARVHVMATRYIPAFDAFRDLAVYDVQPFAQQTAGRAVSSYVEGRNIGDEYRYILERRHETRFPGNMNERPGMLLNPFVLRTTDTGQQNAARGGEFAPSSKADDLVASRQREQAKAEGEVGGFSDLDFLPAPSMVAVNLVPDKDGTITIPISSLGDRQHVRFIAVDPLSTAMRSIHLKASSPKRIDLRLAVSFNPEIHLDQIKEFRSLKPGATVRSDKDSSVRMEVVDSVSRMYNLFATINRKSALADFEFVTRWPELDEREKRDLYSKHACHELSFFVSRKDSTFFEKIVRPYLQNKMHKTFMDHYLLGNDMSPFLHPWAYRRLNAAEKILLADRLEGEIPHTIQFVRDAVEMVPVNVTRNTALFDTAFGSRGLQMADGDIKLGISPSSGLFRRNSRIDGALAGRRPALAAPQSVDFSGGVRLSPGMPQASDALPAELESKALATEALEERFAAPERTPDAASFWKDREKLMAGKRLYRQLESTQEWVENNYYRLPVEKQTAELVTVNEFWSDFAARNRDEPFVSRHLLSANRNFTEMMLAISVTDLPFKSPDHDRTTNDGVTTFTAAGPIIVAVDEIREAEVAADESSILVSQNFYRQNERYRQVGGQKLDRFLTEEFIVNTVYGCQVAVTNPTSAPQTLSLILQIPQGALPVLKSQYTRRVAVRLKPFTTLTHNYYFYFPDAGTYPHYPVQVTSSGKVVAFAKAFEFQVVQQPTSVDTESWEHVSQFASTDQVINFLKEKNVNGIDLGRIAWRMKDSRAFAGITDTLSRRHVYNETLWSYAIHHNVTNRIEEYLSNQKSYYSRVGMQISSPILTVNAIDRHAYQQRDYSPLVNARAHRLGARRKILNDRLRTQWQKLIRLLSYQQSFDNEQLMTITYYLLLQDRIEEAMTMFANVDPDHVNARIQYDYCAAYMDFFDDEPTIAAAMVDKYADYPVKRWRNRFAALKSQLEEINGGDPRSTDPEDSQQSNTLLASSDCSFDLEVEKKEVAIDFQNMEKLTINYYLMDIELLFSRNPFVQQYGSRFSNIRPNLSQTITLPAGESRTTFELPEELHNSNVLVEVNGRGKKKAAAYYSNSLTVQMIENYGQLKVTDTSSGKPLSRVYIKTYAKMSDGRLRFYKDGYTDLRGRFDYASLNTDDLASVSRFAVLVLSDSNGAVVEEARPPQR